MTSDQSRGADSMVRNSDLERSATVPTVEGLMKLVEDVGHHSNLMAHTAGGPRFFVCKEDRDKTRRAIRDYATRLAAISRATQPTKGEA